MTLTSTAAAWCSRHSVPRRGVASVGEREKVVGLSRKVFGSRLMDDSLERLAVWFWGAVGGFLIGAGFSQDWSWSHWVGGAVIAFFFYWLAKKHR